MRYHYNDDEILKRQNKEIDCKNKEIEAHNQEVDRKNKEIDIYNKENRANKPKLPRKPLIKKRTLDKSIRNDKSICVFAEEFNKTFGLHNNSTESVALRDLVLQWSDFSGV